MMQPATDWTDVLIYFVPALLVLMAMFAMVKRFTDTQLTLLRKLLDRDIQLKAMEDRMNRQRDGLPLKLQAYERLILFLERISPDSLLIRVHQAEMPARLFYGELMANIRAEFEHNLSQQLYVTDDCWNAVVESKDQSVAWLKQAFDALPANASSVQLSAKIFEMASQSAGWPTQETIYTVKTEAQRLFQ